MDKSNFTFGLTRKKFDELEQLLSQTPCPRCGEVKEIRLTYSNGVCQIGGYCCDEHYRVLCDIVRANI